MMTGRAAVLAFACALGSTGGVARAQTTIPTFVLANGGQHASGPAHGVQGTVGQAVIGFAAGPANRHGAGFWYRGAGHVSAVDPVLPTAFVAPSLGQSSPNPFNPRTTISFATTAAGRVALRVYDLAGRQVRVLVDGELPSGVHTVVFDARELASGVYVCRLTAGGFTQARKLALVR